MKKVYITIAVCLVVLAAALIIFQIDRYHDATSGEYDPVPDIGSLKVTLPDEPETSPPRETETETDTDTESTAEPPRETEATLDFDPLWEMNEDVCAWIEIGGTVVDYPVMFCPEGDDERYLRRAVNGDYYIGGSLFIQGKYNERDFTSPVTIIYGHTMPDETLFGQLERIYSSRLTFDECRDIKIYLPDSVEHYEVFAAVPFDSYHVLSVYDFTNDYWYKNFFNRVKNVRHLAATVSEEDLPTPGDRVLILSTCMNEDPNYRYLVMAVNRNDIGD